MGLVAAIGLIVVNRLAQLVLPASTKPLIDNILLRGNYGGMNRLLVVLAAAALVQSLTWYGTLRLMHDVAHYFAMRLRHILVRHLVRLPIGAFESRKTGELSARVMSDTDTASSLFGAGTIQLLGSAITAVLAVAYVWSLSRRLTLLAMLGLLVLAGIARLGLLRIHRLYKRVGEVNGEVNGRLTETLLGMPVVKACRAEVSECRVLEKETDRLRGVSLRAAYAGSAVYALVMREYQTGFVTMLRTHDTAEGGIRGGVAHHLRWVAANRSEAALLLGDRLDSAELREANRAFFTAVRDWWRPHHTYGALRPMQADVTAALWIGPAQEFSRYWIAGDEPRMRRGVIKSFADAAWMTLRANDIEEDG